MAHLMRWAVDDFLRHLQALALDHLAPPVICLSEACELDSMRLARLPGLLRMHSSVATFGPKPVPTKRSQPEIFERPKSNLATALW